MIYKVLESEYKGFRLVLDESGDKYIWNCIIGDYVLKFPTIIDAHEFIDNITKEGKVIARKYGGKVVSEPPTFGKSKSVEVGSSIKA